MLGVRPLLGRTFTTTDDREGAQPTVVLTHAFWTNVLGADPEVIGSGLSLTGVDFTVIAVLPAGFVFPQGVDVFTALGTRPALANNRTVFLKVVGRLGRGVSREQATAELDGIVSRLQAHGPGPNAGDQAAALTPLREHILGTGRGIAALLFAGAVVLLLVAVVNLSGLLATRASRRGGEVALRLSLGASTPRSAPAVRSRGSGSRDAGNPRRNRLGGRDPGRRDCAGAGWHRPNHVRFDRRLVTPLCRGVSRGDHSRDRLRPVADGQKHVHRGTAAPEHSRRRQFGSHPTRRQRASRRRGNRDGGVAHRGRRPHRELPQPARRRPGFRPRGCPDRLREPQPRALPRRRDTAAVLSERDCASGRERGGRGGRRGAAEDRWRG